MGILSSFLALVSLGAHVVIPARLAGDASEGSDTAPRRAWTRAALPLLFGACTATLLWLGRNPDAPIGIGWGSDAFTMGTVRATGVLLSMLALADLLSVFGYRHLEPRGWYLLSLAAVPALVASSLLLEILRVGQGPRTSLGALSLAVLCRVVAALATAEGLAPTPRRTARVPPGRPRPWWRHWAVAAGGVLPLYPLALPVDVRHLLWQGGEALTLGAAVLLFLAARALPRRLQRPALLAAGLLTALVFARATELAATFPVHLRPLPGL